MDRPARERITGTDAGETHSYRFGPTRIELSGHAPAFSERFETLFADCRPGAEALPLAWRCSFQDEPAAAAVHVRLSPGDVVERPAPTTMTLARELFAERGYVEVEAPYGAEGWRVLQQRGQPEPTWLVRDVNGGQELWVHRDAAWPSLLGNLLLGAALRAQGDLAYLHAGSVGTDDGMLLLVGDKGRGKTTLSLALAARGLPLGGDELAGVELSSGRVHAVPRALSMREGPRSARAQEHLAGHEATWEEWPDGTRRERLRASHLYPLAAPARLRAIVLLEEFRDHPQLEPLESAARHVGRLGLHPCSLAGLPAARRALALASLLARTPCYRLWPGAPDATAECLLEFLDRR